MFMHKIKSIDKTKFTKDILVVILIVETGQKLKIWKDMKEVFPLCSNVYKWKEYEEHFVIDSQL